MPGVSDTPSLGTWGCGEHEGTPFLSGAGCLGRECSFIVQFGFHLGGRRRLCGEGSWCSSQRAGEVDKGFAEEVDEGFVGEVAERERRGGRERLAPGSRTIIIRVRIEDLNMRQVFGIYDQGYGQGQGSGSR